MIFPTLAQGVGSATCCREFSRPHGSSIASIMIEFGSEESSRHVSGAICHGRAAHGKSSHHGAKWTAEHSISIASAGEPIKKKRWITLFIKARRAATDGRDCCHCEAVPPVLRISVRTVMPYVYVNAALSLMFIAVWAMAGHILASERRDEGSRSANFRRSRLYWEPDE